MIELRGKLIVCIFITALCSIIYGQFAVSGTEKLEEISVTYEETPFVPIIYFTSGSDIVDSRFNVVLKELAQRIEDNPDVILDIRGYYHRGGDGVAGDAGLVRRRADAVRAKLIQFKPDILNRVYVQPTIDPTLVRRGKHGSLNPAIRQENQRVEFSIKPLISIESANIEEQRYRIERLLIDNPLAVAFVPDPDSKVFKKMPENIKARIFHGKDDEIVISAEWVIGKPLASTRSNANPARKSCSNCATFRWDGLKADNFNPLWNYSTSHIESKSSGITRTWGKPLKFKAERYSVSEKFILARYELDMLEPPADLTSKANRELIAGHIIDFTNRTDNFKITIIGHTDDIDDPEKSRQMSLFWAQKELDELRTIIIVRLRLSSERELDKWLKSNGISISAIGESDRVSSGIAGKMSSDNAHPEGRVANRRVEIKIEN